MLKPVPWNLVSREPPGEVVFPKCEYYVFGRERSNKATLQLRSFHSVFSECLLKLLLSRVIWRMRSFASHLQQDTVNIHTLRWGGVEGMDDQPSPPPLIWMRKGLLDLTLQLGPDTGSGSSSVPAFCADSWAPRLMVSRWLIVREASSMHNPRSLWPQPSMSFGRGIRLYSLWGHLGCRVMDAAFSQHPAIASAQQSFSSSRANPGDWCWEGHQELCAQQQVQGLKQLYFFFLYKQQDAAAGSVNKSRVWQSGSLLPLSWKDDLSHLHQTFIGEFRHRSAALSSGPLLTPFIWKWISPMSLWLELADGPARPDLAETQASEKTSWFSICTSATEVFRASCDYPQRACLQPLPLSDTRIEQLWWTLCRTQSLKQLLLDPLRKSLLTSRDTSSGLVPEVDASPCPQSWGWFRWRKGSRLWRIKDPQVLLE